MQIEPGLHRIEAPLGDRYIAMYLVEGDDACALVDTGVQESIHGSLMPYLKRIGRSPQAIRWIINTHADFDHIGGNSLAHQLCPEAELVCGAEDRELIEDVDRLIDDRYGQFRQHGVDQTPQAKEFIRSATGAIRLDATAGEGMRLGLGGRHLEVLSTPGHSDGHLSLIDSESGAALIGDAVLGNGVLTSDGQPAFPPTYRSVAAYLETIQRLNERDAPILLTAHYAVARGGDVAEFLHGSLEYTRHVESTVLDLLSTSPGPMTLLEVVAAAAPSLGPWAPEPAQSLVYPVLGHLEALEGDGLLVRTSSRGLPAWRVPA